VSSVVQSARKLGKKRIFMVDLAQAIHQTTGRYSASGALFEQVRFEVQANRQIAQKRELELRIPIKQSRTLVKNGAHHSPAYVCGDDSVLDSIRNEFREFWKSHFPIGREPVSSPVHPIGGHFCRFDSAQNRWYHILFFQIDNEAEKSITYGFLGIAEEVKPHRDCRIKKGLRLTDETNLRKYYQTYRNFAYRSNLGTPDYDAGEGDGDLDGVILFNVFLNTKIRSNSFVSMEVLKHCWERALRSGSRKTDLPWESGDPPGARIRTATVSLDLRKSTSLMDQVENRQAFAEWLESLSEICREIAHDNFGIFDKFTGDGIIAHFTDEEMHGEAIAANSIIRAFTCSCELVRAVDIHLDALRPRLRFNIAASRPAVGIAFDVAAWSLDRDGRPIVVGKGVVNACRLNSGDPGWIQMAYNMKRHLKEAVPTEVFDVIEPALVDRHKDLKPELQPECFRLANADIKLGRSRAALEAIVERISSQVKEGHEDRKRLIALEGW